MSLTDLTDRSARISALLRGADAQMRKAPSIELACRIRILEAEEKAARAAVRNHPEHSRVQS